jgi:hypothetical protein
MCVYHNCPACGSFVKIGYVTVIIYTREQINVYPSILNFETDLGDWVQKVSI